MGASPVIGGIVIAILLLGVVYVAVSPMFPIALVEEKKEAEVMAEYALNSTQLPGVDYVELNVAIKTGGVDIVFVDDSDLIYKFVLGQDEDSTEPSVVYTQLDDKLLVEVSAGSGSIEATFGNHPVYSGVVNVGAGGISIALSEHANVGTLNLTVTYAGGISSEILDGASFDRLNLKTNVGGVMLQVDVPTLERSSSISSDVEVGGVMVQSLSTGPDVGLRLWALADIGGIALNPEGFEVVKQTLTECEIVTSNYAEAATKLDIAITTGLGGTAINQSFPGALPSGASKQD